jgi:hypothetical protein
MEIWLKINETVSSLFLMLCVIGALAHTDGGCPFSLRIVAGILLLFLGVSWPFYAIFNIWG